MRALILFLLAISFTAETFAVIRTVSNAPTSGAQFSSIQAAVDASASGDTIYVHGSANNYDQFVILDKKLTVIGPGSYPVKNLPLRAVINGVILRNSSAPGSPEGTELHGLVFQQHANLSQNNSSDLPFGGLRLIRCEFLQVVSFSLGTSNVLFESCAFITAINFNTGASNSISNLLFQNCVFFANGCCTGSSVNGLSTNISNVMFNHNVFYSDANVAAFGSNCQFLTFTNNIFIKRNLSANISNSTFTNNITYLCGAVSDTVWIRNGNTGTGNIAGQDPQMADQAIISNGGYGGGVNFKITAGPADNAGADGKDLGLLFDPTGSLNWDNARNSRFPRIFSMNITNPTIAAGGNINVTVEARKSN